ncbi:DUF1015 family protein [Propionicicella superfundia]|uniref:DUF1015 family protein n=1 Tax=Propionicicella superfundia TaxID=348582 RepID=UPI0003FB5E11|nr:DUF1015 domain-containing protein [Propionicicella superfundia]
MPRFFPFPALRYAPGSDLSAVTAPPYDVLSEADVTALAARDPHNIVHVDVPSGDPGSYEAAAATLREWVRTGVLVRDERPSFTIYRMRFTDPTGATRQTSGVLGALGVYDYAEQQVLPHERITPKASTDRLDLTRATRANLSPVWGLSLAEGLTAALEKPGEPVGILTEDGVTHIVERVTDPARLAAIEQIVARDAVLIADGHHRYGVAQTYRAEREAAADPGGADTTLAFLNELVADQLSVAAIHRLYAGVPFADLRVALAACFDLSPGPSPDAAALRRMDESGRLLLVAPDGSTEWLAPRADAFDGVRDLDGARLERALDGLDAHVTYQHGVAEVVEALSGGRFSAAVLIRPTSVAEIVTTAREGLLMPPKSTFFTPKLQTGLTIREIAQPSQVDNPSR